MTPSQRDEDMKAFGYWINKTQWEGNTSQLNSWLAALEYERERVKRECPLESWECKKLERELRAEIKELRERVKREKGTGDCKCGHTKSQHIYEEGACRPGFICPCEKYTPPRPEPTFSEVLAVLRGKECGDGMFDTVVAFLEEHFKTTPRPEPGTQDDERDADTFCYKPFDYHTVNQLGAVRRGRYDGFLAGRRTCACRKC